MLAVVEHEGSVDPRAGILSKVEDRPAQALIQCCLSLPNVFVVIVGVERDHFTVKVFFLDFGKTLDLLLLIRAHQQLLSSRKLFDEVKDLRL